MRVISINFFVTVLFASLVFSCTDTSEDSAERSLSVKLVANSKCKHLKSAGIVDQTPTSQSCIEYSFDQNTNILTVNHLNAGFNCCPDSLFCTVVFRNDTIIIQEAEKSMGCKCNCLYDLKMEVSGVEAGKYQLRMIEPYSGNQDKLAFGLDLQKQNQGTWCVTRKQYPWGE